MEKLKQFWQKIKQAWLNFVDKHPKLSKWIHEGGFFILISNLITILRSLSMTFLTPAFASFLGTETWGWPNVPLTLFGQTFNFQIIGYDALVGGLAYTVAFYVASLFFEVINFFMQRKFTFRSNGNIAYQGSIYFVAWCVITIIVNAINSIWTGVAVAFLPDVLYNLLTTFIQGGVSMIVFFFVNKIIFSDSFQNNPELAKEKEKEEEKEA